MLLALRLPVRKLRKEPPEQQLLKTSNAKKIVFLLESNLQPLEYRSTALPSRLEKTFPRVINFGYLDPETCLLYGFNKKSIKMFLTFAGQSFYV